MQRSTFSQEPIIGLLKEHPAGASASDLSNAISGATFYTWRSKHGGTEPTSHAILRWQEDRALP